MYSFVLNLNTNVTAWHTGYTEETNFLTKDKGGTEFFDMLNCAVASKEFIIKPDFTWEVPSPTSDSTVPAVGSEFFTSKGILEHQHESVKPCAHLKYLNSWCRYNSFLNELMISIKDEDEYAINIVSVHGKVIHTLPPRLFKTGVNSIALFEKTLPQGVYILRIQSLSEQVTHRFVVR